jgi:hypothetical protein
MSQPYSEPAELTRLLEALSARSLADQMRAAQRYRALLEQVAAGEIDAVQLRTEYDRLITEQSAKLANELTALGVNYYRAVLDLNRESVERLFDDLVSGVRSSRPTEEGAAAAEAPSSPRQVELRMEGRPGGVVETGFTIENNRLEPADVVFLVSDFVDDTVEPFRASLELDPPRLTVPPGEEREVRLRLELDPALFVPDRQYVAQVLVRGTDELEIRLVVAVTG